MSGKIVHLGNIRPIARIGVTLYDILVWGAARHNGGIPDMNPGFNADWYPMVIPLWNTERGQQLWAVYNPDEMAFYIYELNAPGDRGAATGKANYINNYPVLFDFKKPETWPDRFPFESVMTGGGIFEVLAVEAAVRANAFGPNVPKSELDTEDINYWVDPRIQLATTIHKSGLIGSLNGDHEVFFMMKTRGATFKPDGMDEPIDVPGAWMSKDRVAVLPDIPYNVQTIYTTKRRVSPHKDSAEMRPPIPANTVVEVQAQYRVGGDLWLYNEDVGFFAALHMSVPGTNYAVRPVTLVDATAHDMNQWAKFMLNQYAKRPSFAGEAGAFHEAIFQTVDFPVFDPAGVSPPPPPPDPEPEPEPTLPPYPGMSNQDMINVFYLAREGANAWPDIEDADLAYMALPDQRPEIYRGPFVEDMTIDEDLRDKMLMVLSDGDPDTPPEPPEPPALNSFPRTMDGAAKVRPITIPPKGNLQLNAKGFWIDTHTKNKKYLESIGEKPVKIPDGTVVDVARNYYEEVRGGNETLEINLGPDGQMRADGGMMWYLIADTERNQADEIVSTVIGQLIRVRDTFV